MCRVNDTKVNNLDKAFEVFVSYNSVTHKSICLSIITMFHFYNPLHAYVVTHRTTGRVNPAVPFLYIIKTYYNLQLTNEIEHYNYILLKLFQILVILDQKIIYTIFITYYRYLVKTINKKSWIILTTPTFHKSITTTATLCGCRRCYRFIRGNIEKFFFLHWPNLKCQSDCKVFFFECFF